MHPFQATAVAPRDHRPSGRKPGDRRPGDRRPGDRRLYAPGPVPGGVVLAAFAATAVVAVVQLVRALRRPYLVETYQASQFWLTYEHGFIRRGLPGQVLVLLTDGTPSAAEVTVAALTLLVLGIVALVVVVAAVLRCVPVHLRPTTAALLVCSPFTFALVLQDLGRYDAVGLAALAVVVAVAWWWTPVPALFAMSLALLVAAAAQEVLAAFLAPLAVLAVRHLLPGRWGGAAAVTVLPGVGLAVWGLIANPPTWALLEAVDRANAVRPDVLRTSPVNAIAALSQDFGDSLAHLAAMDPYVMPLLNLVFGACCLVAAGLVWQAGGYREPWLFGLLAAWCAVAALALGVAAIDYKRWWAMAFVALVAAVPLLRAQPTGRHCRRSVPPRLLRALSRPWIVTAVLVASVVGQLVPVGAAILLDPNAQTQIFLE